jgi:phosphoglycolate phosphatase
VSPVWKLVIFDLDGTLVDTAPDIAACANAVFAEEGLGKKSLKAVYTSIGLGVHELFRRLLEGEAVPDVFRLERMAARFKSLYADRIAVDSRPYPGVREMLEGPLSGIDKAIVTNKPHVLSVRLLEALDWARHFRRVVGMHNGCPAKPDPAGVRDVLSTLNCPPERAILVGDSSIDCETARNAGTSFAWVSYGYEETEPEPGVRTFTQASEWREIVDGIIRR